MSGRHPMPGSFNGSTLKMNREQFNQTRQKKFQKVQRHQAQIHKWLLGDSSVKPSPGRRIKRIWTSEEPYMLWFLNFHMVHEFCYTLKSYLYYHFYTVGLWDLWRLLVSYPAWSLQLWWTSYVRLHLISSQWLIAHWLKQKSQTSHKWTN